MAAGGGLPLVERRDRAADPACAGAEASHAGAGLGLAGPGGKPNVRGCVACQRRPGPGKSLEESQPRASTFTSRDHDRMGRGPRRWRRRSWLIEASTRRDMARRDRQWARTRMRPYIAYFKYAVQQGFQTLATVYKRDATDVAHLVLTISATLCSL